MSIFDLLLAEALAAGIAREAASREEPTPENFFVLPPDDEAWKKLYATCTKENLVVCVEVTKESHRPSLNTHPHFLELAKSVPNIPFFQLKTRLGQTFDMARKDLGGIDTAPTLVIAYFDKDGVRIKQVEGEEKIKFGIALGIIERTIKEFLEERAKLKITEHLAGVFMEDLERKRRKEYDEKLEKEKNNLERRLKEKEEQQRKEREKEESERKKKDEIVKMDLKTARIADIKKKMDELQISHLGAITREDLIQQVQKAIPSLSYAKGQDDKSRLLAGYVTSNRHTEDVSFLQTSDDGAIDDGGSIVSAADPEDELLETRMLYACTLHDMDILGRISKREEGVVVRAKCTKPGIPKPSRLYALKIIVNIHDTSTFTKVQTDFKNEYEILSGLPRHKNIVQLFAFFYDRPKAYPVLNDLRDGIALCLLMEHLSQNMQEHLDNLNRATGPKSSDSIQWLKDLVCGLHFLFKHHVVHRDIKLENLLMAGNSIKISDFGTAIRLDSAMKLPFSYVLPRGGNSAHLAPEILNVRASPGRYLDYSKQPVWEAGVLAYELAGHKSPFERSSVDQRAYSVSSLPPLAFTYNRSSANQQSLPPALTRLVRSMLEFEPDDRPTLDAVKDKLAVIA